MDNREWAVCAAMLSSFYPDSFKMGNKAQVDMWFMALAHLPGERVKAAILHMARTQKGFPSVADICQIADPPKVEADEAWREALRFCTSAHVHHTVYQGGKPVEFQFSDPLIPLVLKGFNNGKEIAAAGEDDLGILRAQFQKAYDAAKKRGARQETFTALGVGNGAIPQIKASELVKSMDGGK
jgi:hypothetical protein